MAKKTIVELKDELGKLKDERQGIFDTLKKESRKANETEQRRLDEIVSKVAEVEFEIKLAEARNKQRPVNTRKKEGNTVLLRAVRDMVSGRISDSSNALFEAGISSMRSAGIASENGFVIPMEYRGDYVQATVEGDGQEIVSEELLDILTPLRDKLVLVEAGANFMTGLVGNIGLPSYSGSNAAWEDEVRAAKNGKGTFEKKTFSPKRLTTYIDVSKQFLAQDSVGANAMLMNDLTTAVAIKLQSTIFGNHAHAANMPDGFFTGTPEFVMSGTATYAGIVDMETSVDTDNALYGNLAYIMSPKARGILKTTLKAANVAEGFIYANKMVNDYNTFVTSGMPVGLQDGADEAGIIFGNWADLVIGQWGGIELTVDPYTQAINGAVRIVVNAYFDAVKRRDESFAVGSLK